MLSLEWVERGLVGGGFAIGLCILIFIRLRWKMTRRWREVEEATRVIEPVLHAWLARDAEISSVKLALRGLRPHAAFSSMTRLVVQQVTFELQQQLAKELRAEPWVGTILRRATSVFWWRRFDAARLLCAVGVEGDEPLVAALLSDRVAAVRLVAMDAAARLHGQELVDRELDTLPLRQDAVQTYQLAAMVRQRVLVASALIPRLTADAPLQSLSAWIDAAGALADPEALKRVRDLAGHPAPEVRVRVARALRRLSDPDTPVVLVQLLGDEDWRVRAQAARALGALRCGDATESLVRAVCDRSWWVRYRSALALAQIAGPARAALLDLRSCDDAMARDMATLVAGLSSAAVVEMSEV